MKKNVLGGLAVMFVTLSLFFMMDMVSKNKVSQTQNGNRNF